MKVNELMLGDWVHRPDCNDKVMAIFPTGIGGLDRLRGVIDESELEPIPLTEEMLQKNGFVPCENGWSEKRYEWYWFIQVRFTKAVQIEIIKYCEGISKFQNKYVHEPQHALRLCGLHELADEWRAQ